MDDGAILSALQKGVTAAVAASTMATLPVSYIGKSFTRPVDGKFLEIVWIPNNRVGDFWGEEKNYQGILRIILHWPNKGTDAYAALAVLKSISSYFAKGRLLSGVQIYEKPDLTGALSDGDEMLYPASIRYQSYRS